METTAVPRTTSRVVTASVILVVTAASVIRLWPSFAPGGLTAIREYDDAVMFTVTLSWLHGLLPYADVVFLHPPGILVLLAPLAALAPSLGDPGALGMARIVWAVLGSLNTGMIALLLRRFGAAAVLLGGGYYALVGIAGEHTVMLEAVLNLGLLCGLVLLSSRRAAPRTLLAGVALGLALACKYWAIIDVVLLALLSTARRGGRGLLRFGLGVAVTAGAIAGPLFVLAPAQMWDQTVVTQLSRPQDAAMPLADRAMSFNPLSTVSFASAPAVQGFMLVLLVALLAVGLVPLVRAVRQGRRPSEWEDEVWWGIIAATHLTVLAASGVFYYHYAAWGAAPLSLVLGAAVGRWWSRGGVRPRQRPVLLGCVAVAVILALVLPLRKIPEFADLSPLRDWAQTRTCVWADTGVMVAIDTTSRNLLHGCPFDADPYGVFLTMHSPELAKVDEPRWRARMFTQLEASDGVILPVDRSQWWLDDEQVAALERDYVLVGNLGGSAMWNRRG